MNYNHSNVFLHIRRAIVGLLILAFNGCASESQVKNGGEKTGAEKTRGEVYVAPRPVYSGPKIKVALGEIKNDTGVQTESEATGTTIQTGAAAAPPDKKLTVRDPIGTGARDQLMTALMNTGYFIVVEDETVAQYRIQGSITGYDPNQSSTAAGYGWGRTRRASDPTVSPGNVFVQVLSPNAVAGFSQKGYIAANIHLYDEGLKGFVASTAVEAHPASRGGGMNLTSAMPAIGRAFGVRMPAGSMVDAGTQSRVPLQKSIQECMNKAADWMCDYIAKNPPTPVTDKKPAVATAEASSPAPSSNAPDAIIMKDDSEIRGTIQAATVKFKTAYGEMSVQTSEIVEFKEGFLTLHDGSKTKGKFDGCTITIKTTKDTMNLPGGDIVSIRHSSRAAENK